MDAEELLVRLARAAQQRFPASGDRPRIVALRHLPARPPRTVPLPADLPAPLPQRLEQAGVRALYSHQAEAFTRLRAGEHVVVATGTASGKSLCYQLPVLDRLLRDDKATALYLGPTKALARDQLRALRSFRLPHVRAAAYDGDTPPSEREAVRRTANVLLTNPDMLHVGLLGSHRRWGDFLHRLAFVVVDECHVARGVFGSHVAAILRRLRRVCLHYSAAPTFALASATIGNPGEHAEHLVGAPVTAVTRDGAPRPRVAMALWEPPLIDPGSGARRSTLAEAAELLAGLVRQGTTTLAFVKSRKGAELVAAHAQRLTAGDGQHGRPAAQLPPAAAPGAPRGGAGVPAAAGRSVLAYRGGHLPEERRAVERALVDGTVGGVATTDALELGMDIGSVDAVVIAGWPGTAASLWQQAGRAGRRGQEAVVSFIAADDPLDHYLLAHPDQLWDRSVEAALTDVTNPYVLTPHLRCAAWELPLEADDEIFSPMLPPGGLEGWLAAEAEQGRLRERGGRFYWAGRGSPAAGVGIRSAGGEVFRIVEQATGALIGDVDEARAYRTVHPGAVYLHQGQTYRVTTLDLPDRVAVVQPYRGDEYTRARSDTDIAVLAVEEASAWGRCRMHLGRLEVHTRVLAYERRRLFTDESLGLVELDLPPTRLITRGLWLTMPEDVLAAAGVAAARVPGAAHAAEHAAIGLLPLFAMCDRWDIGGVSTAWHPDTGQATIFIYDGVPGGAGIAERGYRSGDRHLRATLAAVRGCPCTAGCPSCVQSPKCGNGNEPLDKDAAVALLAAVLDERDPSGGPAGRRARRA